MMLTEGASFTALTVRVRFLLGYLWKSYKRNRIILFLMSKFSFSAIQVIGHCFIRFLSIAPTVVSFPLGIKDSIVFT